VSISQISFSESEIVSKVSSETSESTFTQKDNNDGTISFILSVVDKEESPVK
jgi:hypothetical protein